MVSRRLPIPKSSVRIWPPLPFIGSFNIWPEYCRPPHRVTRPDNYEFLVNEFRLNGWGEDYPSLIGYPFEDYYQLVSGSHRWAAALEAGIMIPVDLYSYEFVKAIWGTDDWLLLLKRYSDGKEIPHTKRIENSISL